MVAGAASATPFVVERLDHFIDGLYFLVYLPLFNALWIAVRVALLVLGEEVTRAHGPVVRATTAVALLFFLSPVLERWAMFWAGTSLEAGALDGAFLAGIDYALSRASPPSLSSPAGWEQARMTAPFLALALARTRLSTGRTLFACSVVAIVAFVPSIDGDSPGAGGTRYLLPAPTAVIALALARALEERLTAWVTRRGDRDRAEP